MCLHVRVCVCYGMCKGQGTLAFHFETCLLCPCSVYSRLTGLHTSGEVCCLFPVLPQE